MKYREEYTMSELGKLCKAHANVFPLPPAAIKRSGGAGGEETGTSALSMFIQRYK